MADEKPYNERMKDMRVNVYLSDEAREMLRELGRELFPGRKRVEGMVVETAIRRLYLSEVERESARNRESQ